MSNGIGYPAMCLPALTNLGTYTYISPARPGVATFLSLKVFHPTCLYRSLPDPFYLWLILVPNQLDKTVKVLIVCPLHFGLGCLEISSL